MSESHGHPDVAPPLPADWPKRMPLNVFVVHDGGEVYAIVEQFNIAGMGATRDEAFEDLAGQVHSYLALAISRGERFEDVLRPLPLRRRLRYHAGVALTKALGRRAPHQLKVDEEHVSGSDLGMLACA